MPDTNKNTNDKYLGRHFCRIPARDLFYVEIYDVGLSDYFFESSLQLKFIEYPSLLKLIKIICQKKIPGKTRKMFVRKIFHEITNISGIQRFYFSDYELDKHGRYSESLANTLQSILYHKVLEPLVPYSPYTNEVIFAELKSAYEQKDEPDEELKVEVAQEIFESNLVTDELKLAYLDVYLSNGFYFYQKTKTIGKGFEFFFMTSPCGELLFMFLIHTEGNTEEDNKIEG